MNQLNANELADLIEKGLTMDGVREHSRYYLHRYSDQDAVLACAMGLAYVGLVGDAQEALSLYTQARNAELDKDDGVTGGPLMAKLLNVPYEHLKDMSSRHYTGTPVQTIIDRLRRGEYQWK